MKIETSLKSSVLASATISLLLFIVLLTFSVMNASYFNLPFLFGSTFFMFIVSFFTIKYFIEQYIYNKLKLIYKILRNSDSVKVSQQNIDKATDDVRDFLNQKQQEVNEYKKMENFRNEYIGNVSHELKTPLTNIHGYVETLLNTDLNDKILIEKYLQRTWSNAKKLNEIIQNMALIQRISHHELVLEYINFEIDTLCENIIDEMQVQLDEKSLNMALQNQLKTNMVRADFDKIKLVLENLIQNAILYSHENTTIQVSLFDFDKDILIEIENKGIGIDEHEIPRIFERFYRTKSGREINVKGTGLGLSIVKHILEAHNRKINVRSVKNKSCTFYFTLPKAKN